MKKLILASKSPRRKDLLQQAGYQFTCKSLHTNESYPTHIPVIQIGEYLARKKALDLQKQLEANEVGITADTTVVAGDKLLEKAEDLKQAKAFLQELSGRSHLVITGVCVLDQEKTESFSIATTVYFKKLNEKIIDYYLQKYCPLDKAGAYGIQEWIGLIGIDKIEGSYHNVVGLPVSQLYETLQKFDIYPDM